MTKRGPAAKKILLEEFKIKAKSVTSGRGTAHGWLYIILDDGIRLGSEMRKKIEDRFIEEQLCGTYWGDTGFDTEPSPCIMWKRQDGCLY